MFAVPGWSVSADRLKTQNAEPSHVAQPTSVTVNGEVLSSKSNKKRKRSSGRSKAQDVNSTNFSELWETVIEGKPKTKGKDKEHGGKRQKTSQAESIPEPTDEEGHSFPKEKGQKEKYKNSKTLKEKRREKKAASNQPEAPTDDPSVARAKPTTIVTPPTKTAAKLTPLQTSMRQKLISARFRHLNETLYTKPSAHSLSLFSENPEMFIDYHEGFRRQVEVWPENPVNGYIFSIKARAKARGRQGGKKDRSEETGENGLPPLPRTEGTCNIADLGCGDAALSSSLQPVAKKLHLKIHSFDLHSPSPLVTKADIANLPLEDNSIDIAIFCLALMGTNWVDFIEEAFRVLRWKGELWVAEIKSRFGRVVGKKGGRVEHSVGNRKRPVDKKEKNKLDEEVDDEIAAVEVDGVEPQAHATDVNAFVEVLRKRGFILKSDGKAGEIGAVDLSNKMFLKMYFVKGTTPVKGKCVPIPKGMEKMGLETWKKKPKGKFIDNERDEELISSEAGVLKPCVYKLR
jgi:ribosomal RNA-processing protein 8